MTIPPLGLSTWPVINPACSEAKKQIETEKQNAIREIRGQVAELSVQIAEKVLKAKLSDDKAQMDMINRLLDEVSSDNK